MSENPPGKSPSVYIQVLAGLLWLAGSGVGLYAIYSLYNLSGTLYALVGKDYYTGVLIGQAVAVTGGLAWLIGFILTGEYRRKYAGESKYWRLLGWIIGIELLIILCGLIFG